MKKYISFLCMICQVFLLAAGCANADMSQTDRNDPGTTQSAAVESNDAGEGAAQPDSSIAQPDSNAARPDSNTSQPDSGTAAGAQDNSGNEIGNADDGTDSSGTQKGSTPESDFDGIDLTLLSGTVLTAQLNIIRMELDKYLGSAIKISGTFAAFYNEENDELHTYVFTYMDLAMCCTEGMEFRWNGNHQFPDDYPQEMSAIEVIGVLKSYENQGSRFCYIDVDEKSTMS